MEKKEKKQQGYPGLRFPDDSVKIGQKPASPIQNLPFFAF